MLFPRPCAEKVARLRRAAKRPEIPLTPLWQRSCEKIEIFPLTLPSPAGGEGKHIEIDREIPSPLMGEGQGGGENGEGGIYRQTFPLTNEALAKVFFFDSTSLS